MKNTNILLTMVTFFIQPALFAAYSSTLGQTGDVPIPGYYDNNKRVDPAIYRPSTGLWYATLSAGGSRTFGGLGIAGDVAIQRRPTLPG